MSHTQVETWKEALLLQTQPRDAPHGWVQWK